MTGLTLAQLKSLCTQRVLVAGAGKSGISAARLLEKLGAKVILVDDKQVTASELKSVEIHAGGILPQHLEDVDLIVLSPGLPRAHPVIQQAIKGNIPIVAEIEIAAAYLPNTRFVGITGTNGKSTTTTMMSSILQAVDQGAFAGGNLGTPLCDIVFEEKNPKFGVLELSSYHLETIHTLSLEAAAVTNLTPDHLDRYPSIEDYYLAKAGIFSLLSKDGKASLNAGDATSLQFLNDKIDRRFDFNVTVGQIGVCIEETNAVVTSEDTSYVIALQSPYILGQHNLQNAAAAIACAHILGISQTQIQLGINAYRGIAHRLEQLGSHNGVLWVNDSKGTNEEASVIAVKSFPARIHLILGGLGKGSNYADLRAACKGRVKAIYAIGDDGQKILRLFKDDFTVFDAKTLENAVALAIRRARPGDVILLSPACASWDQFKSFEHRGNVFKQLFAALKEHA